MVVMSFTTLVVLVIASQAIGIVFAELMFEIKYSDNVRYYLDSKVLNVQKVYRKGKDEIVTVTVFDVMVLVERVIFKILTVIIPIVSVLIFLANLLF